MTGATGRTSAEVVLSHKIALSPARGSQSISTGKLTHEISSVSESNRFAYSHDAFVGFKQAFARGQETPLDDPRVHGAARGLSNYVCKVRRRVVECSRDMRKTNAIGVVFFDKFLHLLHDGASLGSHAPMLASSPQ